MIFSLIIPDLMQSTDDWKREEIGNLLSKKIEVTEIKNDRVNIKDGVLVLDSKFIPFERAGTAKRGNMAVWRLTGKVNYQDAPEITKVVSFKKTKDKIGAEESMTNQAIMEFKKDIEYNTRHTEQSPMLDFVCSAVDYAKKDSSLYDKLKLIAYSNHIIVFELIFGMRGTLGLFTNQEIVNFIKNYQSVYAKSRSHCDPAVFVGYLADAEKFGDRQSFASFRRAKRDMLIQKLGPTTFKDIEKIYNDIDTKNRMKYPDSISAIFQTNKNSHLILDLAKYGFGIFCDICNILSNPRKSISNILTLFDKNGNVSMSGLKNLIDPPLDGTKTIESFIRSACFLHFPAETVEVEGGDDSDDEEDTRETHEAPGVLPYKNEDDNDNKNIKKDE